MVLMIDLFISQDWIFALLDPIVNRGIIIAAKMLIKTIINSVSMIVKPFCLPIFGS